MYAERASERVDIRNSTIEVTAPEFRFVLGQYCSGVAVLAAIVGDRPAGLTCRSFLGISADPPLIAFSVALSSEIFPAIRRSGTCCLNLLAADQFELGERFAESSRAEWAGLTWDPTPETGAPIVRDVLGWMECEIQQEYEVGDHNLVLARVLSLGARSNAKPLLYFRSSYVQIAAN